MRWLVTGASGMLGADAVLLLRARGHEATAATRADLDICDEPAVAWAVSGHDVVLNCAGWTAVDDAETHEAAAFEVNAVGAGVLARAAREHGARIVHVSTDYVFDGTATTPCPADAPVRPATAYGRSKAAGEEQVRGGHPEGHLVVRTAWLYGAQGACFPRTIARLAAERGAVSVVDDQVGQPTWTRDVADLVERLVLAATGPGTHHATAAGATSWYEFARVVCRSAGLGDHVVTPTTSAALRRPAHRPAYSVLDAGSLRRVGVTPIGPWEERWAVAAAEVLAG